ncbi:PAS domain-containing protein [Dapis sp. BLCC M229]|uniref:PAS domain-containing protein n=1 Tax=Dapis sp. BLCC M229 TaxID=3400188 RepID=UPI003CFA1C82
MEPKQIEENLREAKQLYQTILNNTLEGLWIVDAQDKSACILAVNNAYCQMTDYTREELLQMCISRRNTINSCSTYTTDNC